MQARKQNHIFSLNNLEEKTLSNSHEYFLFIFSVLLTKSMLRPTDSHTTDMVKQLSARFTRQKGKWEPEEMATVDASTTSCPQSVPSHLPGVY